jgi:hypothetical protein
MLNEDLKRKNLFGVIALFNTPQELKQACEKIRDRGFQKWDAYTPFPVHGLDHAMGLKPSVLPWIVFIVALTCGVGAFFLWAWMNGVDYKFVIAGKPFMSWQTYLIPAFEVAFLTGAYTAFFAFAFLTKLPKWYHPTFNASQFSKVTNNGFFISIESQDPYFDIVSTPKYLKDIGACSVELIEERS